MKAIKRWFKRRRASRIREVTPWPWGEITPETRKVLAHWLDREDTNLALSIIAAGRPTLFAAGGGDIGENVEVYRERTVAFFNMMRGWDAYYRALQGLRYEKPEYVNPRETFPENEDEV